ncbi:MAG: 5'-nucleotidase C-terminal domain-containing protein [Pyrinomonadaceae bacterium]|nr:5'-nucleotidase C-terminal domain-containing protein [Sphingobacteriaceae bacterium]
MKRITAFALSLIIVFSIVACKTQLKISKKTSKVYAINRDLPLDSFVVAIYNPYKKSIDSQMNSVLAHTLNEIKRSKPEGALNNLSADGIAFTARKRNIDFDFVHLNYKALRVPLPKGQIKAYKIFELMPFENNLVTVKLAGDDVFKLFQYIAALGGDPISGATFKIINGKAIDVKINGQALDDKRSYIILTNDYFANGGDKASFYTNALERKETFLKQRDAFIEYLNYQLKAGKSLDPQLDGRITSDKPIKDE